MRQDLAPEQLRIVAVNDHSSDDTGRIMAEFAASDARVTVVDAPTLPPGWTGKAHACSIGAAALPPDVEWLCFMDADVRAHPLLLSSALDVSLANEITLLSLAPRHELRSFAERMILPCGLYLLAFCQDLKKIQGPDCPDVVATGQFMLMRRAAYFDVGGHALVRNSICEDADLARAFKKQGHRVVMQDGTAVLSTRMYTGWRTLWPGIAKNLSEMLGGPRRTLITTIVAFVIAWTALLLPLLDGVECARGSTDACIALAPASLASAAIFGLHLAGSAYFGIPFWYGLLFPFGYSIGALIAIDSIRWRLIGRVRWKGRVYP